MKFHKYQAIGNDYLVIEGVTEQLTSSLVRRICDRHFGLGSDGILLGAQAPAGRGFDLRIFNPDGSEAEKSGNGIRIFARYLWDSGLVGAEFFSVMTKGGSVRCQVRDNGKLVFVEMGRASFQSVDIPVSGTPREVVAEHLDIGDDALQVTGVSVGNPHCVVHVNDATPELAHRLGPLIENHEMFPNRTNVQFVKVLGPQRIRIEIWERGAGYTLASGSSSCAAAAASVRLGLCNGDIMVDMPGGTLQIGVGPDFSLTMLGPTKKVAKGEISNELLEDAG
jgi:diaminopimelate epimerase